MNSQQKYEEDLKPLELEEKKNITPFGVDKPIERKSFEDIKKQSAEAIKLFCDTFVLKSKKK